MMARVSSNFRRPCTLFENWNKAHAKRKYAEHVKAIGIPELEGTVAAQGVKLISKLLHLDGLYDKTKDKDQKDYRQREVAPKVDAYFAWVKETIMKVTTGAIPTRHSRIV